MSEQIKILNQRLSDNYGKFEDGRPIWRLVFSDSQFEKKFGRYTDYTTNGMFIKQVEEVREVKKYPYDIGKWILERLVPVPPYNQMELVTQTTSYEPVWTFEDANNNPLPPTWKAIELIIFSIHREVAKRFRIPYKDPEVGSNHQETVEIKEKRISALQNELFGDDTAVSDALGLGQGIVVPNSYQTTKGE